MKRSAVPFVLCLAALAVSAYGSVLFWKQYTASTARDAHEYELENVALAGRSSTRKAELIPEKDRRGGDDFKLADQNGKEFDSAEMKGKVWVVSFFFSTCPGTCFRLNQTLANVQSELANDDIKFVSITVDPATDTPEVLKKYGERFKSDDERWTFLTGPIKDIERIGQKRFLLTTKQSVHSEKAVLIDKDGRFAGVFNVLDADELAAMKKALPKLVAEESETAAVSTSQPPSGATSAL